MLGESEKILIRPRYVKKDKNGLRPFQQELLDALSKEEKIIMVEAPVGAGKTFAVRKLLEIKEFERSPIVLTFPTKILMEAQVSSLKSDLGEDKIKIWPWEDFKEGVINIFVYSTDTLVQLVKRKNLPKIDNRGELLYQLFSDIQWFSKYGAIVTSPDVLWLLTQRKYEKSYQILNFMQNSVFVFDEFHCYYGLETFKELIESLVNISRKIYLLSATPVTTSDFLETTNNIYSISFSNSIGTQYDECFNYPVTMTIEAFKFTNIQETLKRLKELIPKIPKPCAIIFDSIFRLRHISRVLKNEFKNIEFIEWSGMKKEKQLKLSNSTIVLATSAVEIGIDMSFKGIIFEAVYWPSAIQRLGRVARKSPGEAIMFTRKDFYPALKDKKEFERAEFENILKQVLNDPKEEVSDGYSFRGQSFNFLLYDEDLNESFIYNENIFAMYEIKDYIDDWRCLEENKKRETLKEFNVPESKIEEILIYDKILPLWGILKGRIKAEYDYIQKNEIIPPTAESNELQIKDFVFYGG